MGVIRKMPIGIQNFEKLRRDGFLYVDKTATIYKLVSRGNYYFLSRPRRFGKSLLLSTIHALFEGKKELFDGTIGSRLKIADEDQFQWEKCPVLHLDLNTEKYDCSDSLINKLNVFLCEQEDIYGKRNEETSLGTRFEGVISRAYHKTGKPVVILVDEYDKPLLQAIGNIELQQAFRTTLKGFYGALKSKDGCIQFALLTGVTKFSKISVFSDLNNLNDISMDANYWDVCGITEDELKTNFQPEIEALAQATGISMEKCLETLRKRYDGYHFEESVPGIYNPFSVLCTLQKCKFGSYWFETGTPTYLAELLKEYDCNLKDMSEVETDADTLSSIDSATHDIIPVIYQSGYLTIKGYDKEFGLYRLGFPNQEVEDGFLRFLLPYYTSTTRSQAAFNIQQFVKDVRSGNTEAFIKRLRSLFADTPYELVKDLENHYQNVIWLISKLMGFFVKAEYHTSRGRIDLVLQTDNYCYVMEFKLDGTAGEALSQIQEKSYTLPFEMNGQQIIRIGMSFSSETRNIEKYLVE